MSVDSTNKNQTTTCSYSYSTFNQVPLHSTTLPFAQLRSPLLRQLQVCWHLVTSALLTITPFIPPYLSTTATSVRTQPCHQWQPRHDAQRQWPPTPSTTTTIRQPPTINHKWRQPPTDEDACPNNNEGTRTIKHPQTDTGINEPRWVSSPQAHMPPHSRLQYRI